MALNLAKKKSIVSDVNTIAVDALSLVVANSRGCTVDQLTQLREKARDQDVYLRVVRNTLAKRAVEGTSFECTQEVLVGPTLLGFSMSDPGAAARIFKDFAKEVESFNVTALSVGGQLLDASQLDKLAKLPTYDQAMAMLMSVMLAPATKLVQTLNAVPSKLVRTIAAVKDQKQDN